MLKDHLRLLNSDFDDILELYLRAAVGAAESYTGQILRNTTWVTEGTADSDTLSTDIYPIRSLLSVTVDGRSVALSSATVSGSRITLPGAAGLPVRVEYTAGYEKLPPDIAAAVLLMAARLFENPADSVEQLPKASTNLLRPYKRWGR